ncbi:hypothetical protein AV654_17040 [Paenibacillus elgii]|uniref:Uncharacterized protein n=1 Tax=Paenibacillus elgii TaxID=189691 RepID=A0A163YBW8_9BACL|nr:hypothetical protein [Paenibacillus elgii]KZE79183.1 hypothetical protein AV654_17040 [Paenibacillus elgii]
MEANKPQKRKFLFNVDIMIEEDTNGRALEKLLHLLNSGFVTDYQIKQGMELGKTIEASLKEAILKKIDTSAELTKSRTNATSAETAPKTPTAANAKEAKAAEEKRPEADPFKQIWEEMRAFQQSNALVRLSVVKEKGVKLSMPCRILNTDPPSGNLTVYHVDEKKVYLLKINEIDDFQAR